MEPRKLQTTKYGASLETEWPKWISEKARRYTVEQ